jgi:RNA polymerase-binding transcription factor DksA
MDSDRARQLLARERERIERGLADLAPTDTGELADYDQHLGDQGTELFERERDEAIRQQLSSELEALERAEARLAEGAYGLSIESGEPIADERLEAFPLAERTAEEQQRYERLNRR